VTVRRRLLTLVFATTLLALTILGVVLMVVIWTAMGASTQARADDSSRVTAAALEDTLEAGGKVSDATLTGLARDEAWLSATVTDGGVFTTGPEPTGGTYHSTTTAGSDGDQVTVTAKIPVSVNVAKVLGQGFIVIALSLFALAVAMLIALFYARRLTRPLEDFAELAERLATGDRRQLARRYGIAELDSVADVLDRGVGNFNMLLESERRVTAEASHQLRTPLTALSLRLEEILATDDLDVVRSEATAALGQVERLAGVVDDVVSVSRGFPLESMMTYELLELVASQVVEWTPTFAAAGRYVRAEGSAHLVVDGARGAQAQVLATLVENSLVHGHGTTTVRVRAYGSWAVVEVSDEGPGIPPELEAHVFERSVSGADSSGVGLPLARTLVSADGGRLEMLSARPAVFAMFLPTRPPHVHNQVEASSAARDAVVAAADGSEGSAYAGASGRGAAADQAEVLMAASSAAAVSSGKTQRR
jgi:signal transduction histidine kinase